MNRFKNIDGSRSSRIFKMINHAVGTKLKRRGQPAPSVWPDWDILKTAVPTGAGARLTWLGHSGWLVQTAGMSILIDPVMGKRINTFVRRKAHFYGHLHELAPFAAVLITHDHYDHLNIRFLQHLGCEVIAGAGMKKFLQTKKICAQELKWWESERVGRIKITFVPSQHSSRRGILDPNERLWGGFIIEAPNFCLYHAGDTAYFSGFTALAKKFKRIDAALLPIGGYGPEHLRGDDHLNPEKAIRAYLETGARHLLPMHWGTFRISEEPLDEPPRRLRTEWRRQKLDPPHLHILAVGESTHLRRK